MGKKGLALVLVLNLALSLGACASKEEVPETSAEAEVTVIQTEPEPVTDSAAEVTSEESTAHTETAATAPTEESTEHTLASTQPSEETAPEPTHVPHKGVHKPPKKERPKQQPTVPSFTEEAATEPPATRPPVTDPPVTEPPVTRPSVTNPPTTEPPAAEPPVTNPPATEPPATEPPATKPPATEPPATEPPHSSPVSREALSQIRSRFLRLVNAERARAGVGALSSNSYLDSCARVRSREIIGCWGHDRPNGEPFYSIIDRESYPYRKVGENICYTSYLGSRPFTKDDLFVGTDAQISMAAQTIFDGFKASPPHHQNMIDGDYTECGIGIDYVIDESTGMAIFYVSHIFGTR